MLWCSKRRRGAQREQMLADYGAVEYEDSAPVGGRPLYVV